MTSSSLSEKFCDTCEKDNKRIKARTLCYECHTLLCEPCSNYHLRIKINEDHHLVELVQFIKKSESKHDPSASKQTTTSVKDVELAFDFLEKVTLTEDTVLYRGAQVAVESTSDTTEPGKRTTAKQTDPTQQKQTTPKQTDPIQQKQTTPKHTDPIQQKQTTSKQADPTQQKQKTSKQADPTQQKQKTSKQADPTQQKQTTANPTDPTQHTQTTSKQAHPTQHTQTTSKQTEPTQQKQTTTKQADPTQHTQTTSKLTDPTQQKQTTSKQIDHIQQKQTTCKQTDPIQQKQTTCKQTDPIQQKQTTSKQTDRTQQKQTTSKQADPTQQKETKFEQADSARLKATKCLEFSVKRSEDKNVDVTCVLCVSDYVVVVDDVNCILKLFDRNGTYLSFTELKNSTRGITYVYGNMFATCGLSNTVYLWAIHSQENFRRSQAKASEVVSYHVGSWAYGIHYNGTYILLYTTP